MKESKRPRHKTHIRISTGEMAADQQAPFNRAIDSLLAELMRSLDRQQGEVNGNFEEQVGRSARDHRGAPE
jgi:hypothetical protein